MLACASESLNFPAARHISNGGMLGISGLNGGGSVEFCGNQVDQASVAVCGWPRCGAWA